MPIFRVIPSTVRRVVLTVSLALGLAATASAQVAYSFDRFLSGGGGGQDPQKQRLAQQVGAYTCLGISPGPEGNTVRFTIWSRSLQPRARVVNIAFDLGRHAGLFRSVAVVMASPGVKASVVAAQQHPFFRTMTPEFAIDIAHRGHLQPDGLSSGRLIAISATLGDGRTIADVVSALDEGLSPTTGVNGLRVGVIALWLLGGPPPGVPTIQDDGGFVTAGHSPACR